MDDIKRQQEHFDSIAGKYFYDRHTDTSLFLKELLWKYFLSKKKYLRAKNIILEPMCGFAEGKRIVEQNINSSIVYEGFDYSQKIIDLAKIADSDLNVYQMNVLDMRMKEKYDLIVLIGGLHHVYRHLGEVLQKVYEALKPGGYFISYEPTNNMFLSRWVRKQIYASNPLFDPETEQDFNLAELNDNFSRAGFYVKDQIPAGLLSYIFFYNPDAFPMLNFGGRALVRFLFCVDKLLFHNRLGRKLSFATLTLLGKSR